MRSLLGIDLDAVPIFGHRPGVPLRSGRRDGTEVDLKLGNLLIEAKLTEYDFQSAPLRLIDRYSRLEEVFDRESLEDAERCLGDSLPHTNVPHESYDDIAAMIELGEN